MSKKFVDDFEKLPEDSIKVIISFLDRKTLLQMSTVSKDFIISKVFENDIYWKEPFERLIQNYNLNKKNYKFKGFKNGIIEIHRSWISNLRNNYHPNLKKQKFYGYQAFLSVFQEIVPKIDMKCINCGFYGNDTVGKSSLIAKLEDYNYLSKYQNYFPSQIESNEFIVKNQKDKFTLLLHDTPGQQIDTHDRIYSLMRMLVNIKSNLIIFCFSVVDIYSYQTMDFWVKEVKKREKEEIPFILVGTKIDLRDDVEYKKKMKYEEKILTFQDGVELAKKMGCVLYFEVSSKLGIGIEELKRLIVSVSHFEGEEKRNCLSQ